MNQVIIVAALPDGLLRVEFADGRVGEFDVKPFMELDFFTKLKKSNTLIKLVCSFLE